MKSMYEIDPSMPWVHGPEGYITRSELTQQYEKKDGIGSDSPPEVMIARALAYRASELTNYKKEFDDEIFLSYAMDIASKQIPQYIEDIHWKKTSYHDALDKFLNRIDDGGWDDGEIMEYAQAGDDDWYDLPKLSPRLPDDHPSLASDPRGEETISESRLMRLAGLKE
jgi:hypothetical protein